MPAEAPMACVNVPLRYNFSVTRRYEKHQAPQDSGQATYHSAGREFEQAIDDRRVIIRAGPPERGAIPWMEL